eukprot:6211919-Pleurochrysis_carterae.AAC.1
MCQDVQDVVLLGGRGLPLLLLRTGRLAYERRQPLEWTWQDCKAQHSARPVSERRSPPATAAAPGASSLRVCRAALRTAAVRTPHNPS